MLRNSNTVSLADLLESPSRRRKTCFSLSEISEKYRKFEERRVYYIGPGDEGEVLFGIVGTATTFQIPDAIYEAMGKPQDVEVKGSIILKHV